MAKSKWKNKHVITAYELAKQGMRQTEIASVMGVTNGGLMEWSRKKPIFKMALREGKKAYNGNGSAVVSFADYVYKKLPPKIQKLWDRINRLEKSTSGVVKIEAMLEKQGKTVRQYLFLHAWISSNFNISRAMRKTNISKDSFDRWKNNDPDFGDMVEHIIWYKKQFCSDHLIKLVVSGDTAATIFINRTFNRDMYNDSKDINMKVTGEITHNVINIGDLKLPLKIRKAILKAIRKASKNG